MAMTVGGGEGVVSEMNVVPLIDILLVLLIIFMVITPLTPQGLDARIPQRQAPDQPNPPEEENAIVVQVTAGGELRINQQPVEWAALGDRLNDIFKSRGQRVAFVHGDGAVEFQHVARAIDIMRSAGIESVGLLTQKM